MISVGDLYVMYIPYMKSHSPNSGKLQYCLYEHSYGIVIDIDSLCEEDVNDTSHKIEDGEIVVKILDNRANLHYELCLDISDDIDYLETSRANFKVLLHKNQFVVYDSIQIRRHIREYEIIRS